MVSGVVAMRLFVLAWVSRLQALFGVVGAARVGVDAADADVDVDDVGVDAAIGVVGDVVAVAIA
eukprot:10501024-Alexandrium_andersonii.AAC.1